MSVIVIVLFEYLVCFDCSIRAYVYIFLFMQLLK